MMINNYPYSTAEFHWNWLYHLVVVTRSHMDVPKIQDPGFHKAARSHRWRWCQQHVTATSMKEHRPSNKTQVFLHLGDPEVINDHLKLTVTGDDAGVHSVA